MEEHRVTRIEFDILSALLHDDDAASIAGLAEACGHDQSKVHAAALLLASRGWVAVSEVEHEECGLGKAGQALAARPLPERLILQALVQADAPLDIKDLPARTGLAAADVGASLRFLDAKGYALRVAGQLKAAPDAELRLAAVGADERLLAALAAGPVRRDALESEQGIDVEAALGLLKGRRDAVDVRRRKVRTVALTAAGRAAAAQGLRVRQEVTTLGRELLLDGGWRDVTLKPYNVHDEVAVVRPGKAHPLQRVFETTRRIFLELGFNEVASPHVESAFWDFDALFQPQDHPAREMQDTFYLSDPPRCALPAADYVNAVRATHEHGGETGSVGWRYRWEPERAEQVVLRTHCTAASVRALARNPRAPRKVFCIGPVFRNETTDYKHLPVFHQVDGIVVDARGSFATLLGILSHFYTKMGFERFEFRPGFFPYTEPSVEVFVWHPGRRDWVEMGGAGVFRPEVTLPTGCDVPVLAWGLGLERLAMFRLGEETISTLYQGLPGGRGGRVSWLREVALCR